MMTTSGNSRAKKLLVGGVAALFVIGAGAAPSFASLWSPNIGTVAAVCFTADDLPDVGAEQLAAAAAAWNGASTNLDVSAGNCRSEHVVPVKTGELGKPLARTTWAGDPKIMAEIDVDIENTLSLGGSNATAWRTVLCHEIGHALGLFNDNDHSEDAVSCMQTDISKPYPSPARSDLAELRRLYGGTAKVRTTSEVNNTSGVRDSSVSQATVRPTTKPAQPRTAADKRGRIVDSAESNGGPSRDDATHRQFHQPRSENELAAYDEWTDRLTPQQRFFGSMRIG